MSELSVADLERQERDLVLPRFTLEDAWRLGTSLAERAWGENLPLAIDIRRESFVLFRSVHPGAARDQEAWVQRKAAIVFRMETSSRLFAARMKARNIDPIAMGWLDTGYAITGGSFPIRVAGAGVVAAVTASGLSSEGDHDFVVSGLTSLLTSMT